jgi:hypothetical protein
MYYLRLWHAAVAVAPLAALSAASTDLTVGPTIQEHRHVRGAQAVVAPVHQKKRDWLQAGPL